MKTKKFKSLMGAMGVAALSFTMIGCGGADTGDAGSDIEVTVNREGFPIVDEPITITMMAPGVGMADWADMPFFHAMEEKTNVRFEFTTPPQADFGTALNLAFASQDVADIIFGAGSENLTRAMETDYGGQGILLPLNDLIENYAPNLRAILEEKPEIRQTITSPDGNIYSLPSIQMIGNSVWPSGPIWFNGTWLETLDAEVPTTTDEFVELMKRFRDEEPAGPGVEVFPISDGNALNHMRNWFLSAFGITTRGIEVFDGVVQHNATSDNFRAYLEWMNMLWEEGIIDPETFAQSSEQANAKVYNNQVGVFQNWFPFFSTGETEVESMINPMFFPLTSEWSPERVITASSGIGTGVFAITNSNPSPEATIRWIDFFFSEEGAILANQGPEGFLWEYQENDAGEQVRVFMPEVDVNNTEETRGAVTPFFGIAEPGINVDTPSIFVDPNDEHDTRFWDWIVDQTNHALVPYGKVPFPSIALPHEDADAVSLPTADLNTFLTEAEARFITGLEPINDETWANFQNTIQSIGVEKIVEVWQAAYDRSLQ